MKIVSQLVIVGGGSARHARIQHQPHMGVIANEWMVVMGLREIKATGSLDSEIMLVGEAPGPQEHRAGIPFCGPSFNLCLMLWWRQVGLTRKDFRIDNVFRFWPPKNKLALWTPRAEVEEAAVNLHDRVARMRKLKVIVPTGNYALRALLRKPLWDNKSPKISDWRGSVLTYEHPTCGPIHLIPTKHPAETFRRPTDTPLCVLDWRKIARVLKQGWTTPPEADHNVTPKRLEVDAFKEVVQAAWKADPENNCLSIDIETNPKEGRIICVGFALHTDYSITLRWEKWMRSIRWLCQHPIAKVLQNGLYDAYYLKRVAGIEIANYKWDTLAMHHCYRPYLPHDLGTQISLYTMHPFHKHSAKDEESVKAEKTPYHALARYNGKDCTTTRELRDAHLEGLRRS